MAKRVSIVICAYNNWPDLELAIQSALCQSHKPTEVIVVENSSTGKTWEEVAMGFGGRVRYVRQPNKGDSGAYNTGMREANGDFIQFMDGDDVLAPHKIEKQLEIFEANPDADIVYGPVAHFSTHMNYSSPRAPEGDSRGMSLGAFIQRRGSWIGTAMSLLFRLAPLE